jgi:hypothetical protein
MKSVRLLLKSEPCLHGKNLLVSTSHVISSLSKVSPLFLQHDFLIAKQTIWHDWMHVVPWCSTLVSFHSILAEKENNSLIC